jgi:hypothetical protein
VLLWIRELQEKDQESVRRKASVSDPDRESSVWSVDKTGLLRFRGRAYAPQMRELREKILELHYDDPVSGHFGRARTKELIKRQYH